MAIQVEHVGDVAVVTVDEGADVGALKSELGQLLATGARKIVVDLNEIGELVLEAVCRVKHQVGSAGGALCVSHCPTSELPKLRAVARCHCLPQLFDNRDEALEALQEMGPSAVNAV